MATGKSHKAKLIIIIVTQSVAVAFTITESGHYIQKQILFKSSIYCVVVHRNIMM